MRTRDWWVVVCVESDIDNRLSCQCFWIGEIIDEVYMAIYHFRWTRTQPMFCFGPMYRWRFQFSFYEENKLIGCVCVYIEAARLCRDLRGMRKDRWIWGIEIQHTGCLNSAKSCRSPFKRRQNKITSIKCWLLWIISECLPMFSRPHTW